MLLASWATYQAPGRNDQYQLIQLGQSVYHGGRMYEDCWENKPPGIAWINALGFVVMRGNSLGPWTLPGIIEVLVFTAMWASLRRILSERVTRKVLVLAALVYSLRLYDTPSINPDFYSSIFELAAIAVLIRGAIAPLGTRPHPQGTEQRSGENAIRCTYSYLLCGIAGLFWAGATSVKQVGCVGILVLTLCGVVAAILKPTLRVHVAKATASVWMGFLAGVVAVGAVLWRQGTLNEAWEAIYSFNSGLLNLNDLLAAANNRARIRSELAPLALPLWLALTGVLMSFWYRRFGGFPLAMLVGLIVWWIVALIFAASGPSHAKRYWQATFPPMLILAAVGLHYIQQVQDRLNHPERLTAFVVAVTAAILLASPALYELRAGLASSYAAFIEHPTEREHLAEIATRVRQLTSENDRIYVLDYCPGIYVYADQRPAARFNYPRTEDQLDEITRVLSTNPPRLILVPEKPAPEFERLKNEEYRNFVAGLLRDCEVEEKVQGYIAFHCRDRLNGDDRSSN